MLNYEYHCLQDNLKQIDCFALNELVHRNIVPLNASRFNCARSILSALNITSNFSILFKFLEER